MSRIPGFDAAAGEAAPGRAVRPLAMAAPGMLITLFSFVAPAAAGGWVQAPGTAYVRWSAGILDTDRRFDEHGDEVPFDTAGGFRDTGFRDFTAGLYAEIGVHRDWTVLADFAWKRLEASQPSAVFSTWGAGDLRLGVRRAVIREGRVVLAATAMATMPTGYDESEYPALGSGSGDAAVGLEAGTSAAGAWFVAEGSWRFRAGGYRDQVGGAAGGGLAVARGVALRGEARGSVPVGDAAPDGDLRFDPATVDPAHLELAAAISVAVGGGLAVEAEARGVALGENTLAGTRWSIALATSPAMRIPGARR